MSGSGDADPGPSGSSGSCWSFGQGSADTGLGLSAGRVLPGRIRCLSNPAPPGRLPSLRTRDMTLGGAYKKPKKTFEPNVHAVRKSKDELKGKIQTASKPQRTEREEKKREKREKRVRRRERPPTIQSHSIFEQGPADSSRRPGCRGVTNVRDSTSSSVCKLVKKESEEDEEEILNKLHRDDFIDDLDLENRSKLKPIQLPLCRSVAMKSPGLSRSSCKSLLHCTVHIRPHQRPHHRPQLSALLFRCLWFRCMWSREPASAQTSVHWRSGSSRLRPNRAQTTSAVLGGSAAGAQPVRIRGAVLHAAAGLYALQNQEGDAQGDAQGEED
ncbi:uncharacterized protein LOC115439526 isoform X4 [Sphaeramia orbicularis]|uniref:uncharacterized protein LOC115439526 isoform X4 n=1 Tax=Sphaeramia orbicularis TaxID=375764 RepID=UPI00117E225E|nr:uncharacterized protein LOC115439526 isoform X4 [Sphaeramia orbicularis]